jgi:anthraniloyl-CoA monooxygenase
MARLRIAVIGGGPGGLTAALALKRAHPQWDVGVRERHSAHGTFGYGVGLRWSALDRLIAAAPECADDIRKLSHPLTAQTFRRGPESTTVTSGHGLGVSRSALLTVLRRHAEHAGVRIHTGRTAALTDVRDADVVIAADGAGSRTREALAAQLGATSRTGDPPSRSTP